MSAKGTGATTKAGEDAIAKAPLISHMFHIPLLSKRKKEPVKGVNGPITPKYWNYPLVTRRAKEPNHCVGKSGYASTKWWSYPLLSPPQKRDSAVGKEEFVSQRFWKGPLVTRRKKEPDHAVGKARTILT
jgi:hypothetical protein